MKHLYQKFVFNCEYFHLNICGFDYSQICKCIFYLSIINKCQILKKNYQKTGRVIWLSEWGCQSLILP